MPFRVLADFVMVVHLGFVLFLVIGGVFVLRARPVAWAHLPAVAWGAVSSVLDWRCPLTRLENWLLRQSGAAGYDIGFIEHYLVPILYPVGLTRRLQIALGLGLILLNLAVYLHLFRTSHASGEGGKLPVLEVQMRG